MLNLDSDGVVLDAMDELFLTPPCPVAMPRAYWLLDGDPPQRVLSSQLMLVQPSSAEFERIQRYIDSAGKDDYDMEIMNQLYLDSAMILPHRKYDMLTAEFRSDNHSTYLGSEKESWDPVMAYDEAKFMHFSDWPVPKPWIPMTTSTRAKMEPKCKQDASGEENCVERDMWNGFYSDYLKKREVCAVYAFSSLYRHTHAHTHTQTHTHTYTHTHIHTYTHTHIHTQIHAHTYANSSSRGRLDSILTGSFRRFAERVAKTPNGVPQSNEQQV